VALFFGIFFPFGPSPGGSTLLDHLDHFLIVKNSQE